MTKIPVVKTASIERTMLGGYIVRHKCPHCNGDLKSKEKEIGKPDECPDCGGIFGVSKRFLEQIDDDKARWQYEKDQKKQAKIIDKQKRIQKAEKAKQQRREKKQEQKASLISASSPEPTDLSQTERSVVFQDAQSNEFITSIGQHEGLRIGECWYCKCEIAHYSRQCPYCRMLVEA